MGTTENIHDERAAHSGSRTTVGFTFEFPTREAAGGFFDAVEDLAIATGEWITLSLSHRVVDVMRTHSAAMITDQDIFDLANRFEGEWQPTWGEAAQ
jgi:pterin-4a-carbinolamine dehydratase